MNRTPTKRILVAIGLTVGLCAAVVAAQSDHDRQIDYTITEHLTVLLGSARKVISDHQDVINEQKSGKDLTPSRVLDEAKRNYARTTGHPFPTLETKTPEAQLLLALEGSILDVMGEAQPLINDPSRAFKGFLPAVFAYKVAARFDERAAGVAYLKLTAPAELVRNKTNMPDAWEQRTIKERFQSPAWKVGAHVGEFSDLNGKKAYRLLTPEYYGASCLACHGAPKGETDITGGKKEGAKLGDLGGAVSAAIYLK